MFESHDGTQQVTGTADNTSANLSNFVVDSMKENRPSFKSDYSTANLPGGSEPTQYLEMTPLPAVQPSKPGELQLSPIALDQVEAEIRLNDITPSGDAEFEGLSKQLNHAFASGDLTDFQRVLQSTDDVDLRNDLVSNLGQRLDALEQGISHETQMYATGTSMEFFPQDEQRVYGFTMDLSTNETKALLSDVMTVNVNGNLYPTMVPLLDENKQPIVVETDTASLFQALSQNEVRSIASSNAPLGTLEPIAR